VVTKGAARPPRRAWTETKPIPICLWEMWRLTARSGPTGLGTGVRGQRSCHPGTTPTLCAYLISVGYSSPVNRYTQMKELARQPLPRAAWAVRRVCISRGRKEERPSCGEQGSRGWLRGVVGGWGSSEVGIQGGHRG
jgi:hypothetical protein